MKHLRSINYIFLIIGVFILNIPFVVAKEDFEIKSVSVSEKSSTITVDDLVFEDNTISSNISFNQLNDFVTFDIEVENNTNIDYVLEKINNNINSNYLTIESEDTGKTISNNTTQTIKVKIKYDKELVNHDDINLNNVSLGLVFKNPKTLINPLTGKNIFIFITIVITSILSFYALKNKKSKSLLLLLLLLIPTLVYATESNNVELKFDNITIKGRYLQYRVTINNGTESQEVIRTYGETIGELPEITPKEGYTIDGWVNQEEEKVDESTIVTDTLKIAPKYNQIEYTITYNLNDGTLENENPEKYTIEDEITLNNPSIPGYTFAGWKEGTSDILQTSVTINKGTTGDKVFTAFYSTNQDTKYTVIHRQMNLNGEYVEFEREELHGATDTNVTPQVKQYEGFTSPELQTKNIDGNGETVFTYDYVRNTYEFSITDRSYITTNSTPNGSYYYGTNITIAAVERVGYTFSWSDGDTNLTRTFELKSNKTLTPVYTPNTNTPYKVVHKTMNLDGTTYSTKDEISYFGTTGDEVEPNTNIYEGFTAPEKQRVRIEGNGSTIIEYLYTRNKYHLTIENSEYVETATPSNDYYYGTSITLKAKTRNKYTFVKWSNDNTNSQITFELKGDTVIGPIYSENNHVITFNYNGGEGNEPTRDIEPGHEIGTLPTATRTGYYLDGWYLNITNGEKLTSSFVPTGDTEIFAKWKKSVASIEFGDNTVILDVGEEKNIVITNAEEIEETYNFNIDNSSVATVDSTGKVTGVSIGEAEITIIGSKSNQIKTINVVVLSNQYVVTFNGNGGTPETQVLPVTKGLTIATLPTATKEKHFLEGWFTSILDGIKIENGYRPEQNITLYAKWKKSITNANIENKNIELAKDGTATINITNPSEIEESYTYLSNDESIATVDANGTITGIAPGTTTITITGTESHETITINVTIIAPVTVEYTVTFNYNGTTGTELTRLVESGHEIGNLPTATRTGYYLDGWYLDLTSGEKLTSNYIVNSNVEIIAKWKKSVESMEFEDTNIILDVAEEKNIVITNAGAIEEPYTFTSNNESIATVDSTGKVTGVSIGETTITISGTKTNKNKTINVVVLSNQYVVTFNGNGGTPENQFVEVVKGETIAKLPTVIRQYYYFDGWYTSIPGGTKVEDGYRPEQNITLHAKWKKSVESMEFEETSITLHEEAEQMIVITNSSEIEEPYTFTSNDESIATVDQTGKVTGVSVGNTTITITGTKSNQTKTINVTVTAIEYEVTFNGNGGTPETQTISVTKDETIDTLPTVTREQYYFDGWYTNIPNGVKVENGYRPEQSITLYAKWKKAITYGLIENDNIEVDITDDAEIVITNSSEIEESYTYTSSNPAIATVDQTGKVTGVSVGTTTITITGDESHQSLTVIVKVNDPNQVIYTVHYDANGGTGSMEYQTISKDVPTNLSNNTFIRLNYNFTGWNTASDGTGTSYANGQQVTNIAETEITLYAQWRLTQFPYVFKQDGACTFNGQYANITGEECSDYTNRKYIDTGIALYSTDNKSKDYEVGFTIDHYYFLDNSSQATLFNTKKEASGYPGLVYRTKSGEFEIASRRTSSENSTVDISSSVHTVKIYRINNVIYYSIDGSERTMINNLNSYNPAFTLTAWFGAAPENESGSSAQRYFVGTLSHMYIKLGTYEEESKFVTTLDPNGGTVEPTSLETTPTSKIGELPTPTRQNYDFIGWFTGITEGIEITENYVPTGDSIIYARWEKKPTYHITLEEMGGVEIDDVEVTQGEAIGELPITNYDGYDFDGWYLEPEYTTLVRANYVPTGNITVYAKWVETSFTKVFEQTGACTFNGENSYITGEECSDYANQTYIDTGISLYSEENKSKDYEIGFTIESYNSSQNSSQATLFNTKKEASGYPGVAFRTASSGFTLDSRYTIIEDSTASFVSTVRNIKIYRISNVIYYSIDGGEKLRLNDLNTYNPAFDLTAWFGAAPTDATGSSAQKYFIGTLKNMYIKLGTYQEAGSYKITLNANGGNNSNTNEINIPIGDEIGALPHATRDGYYLDGWYTSLDVTGEKIEENYVPSSSMTLYAKWKKAISSMIVDEEILVGYATEKTIDIENADEIEETWTYESENPAIASVNQNGKISGVSVGETTITISGTNSNHRKEIFILVYPIYTVTYDAQIGHYNNGENTNDVVYGLATKNSRTQNISETGVVNSYYGKNWNESNIVGSNRGDTTKAHVLSFAGADKLHVDVYYRTYSSSSAYARMWAGKQPNYKASTNSTNVSNASTIGGNSSYTYYINGISFIGYKRTFDIQDDSVTFGFYSGTNVYGNSNETGYYALVKWLKKEEGTYEEPTKEGANFLGWYTDTAYSSSNIFDEYTISSDTTVYAKWGHTIRFSANGGTISSSNTKREVIYQQPLGTLPTATKSNYYLDGWYTSADNSGQKVDANYIPTEDITLYAHWKKSVLLAQCKQQTVEKDEEQLFVIDNPSDIEEEYTFTSSDTSILTIDETSGMMRGISIGSAYITIKGLKSNNTKSFYVEVVNTTDITYDANGGKFSNEETTKTMNTTLMIKTSHTQNVSDTGKKNSNYSYYWSEYNIRGTGRTSSDYAAHVITIPGATNLTVDIYYNSYSTSYAWATVWQGERSNYTAYSFYTSGITNAQKLGGSQTETYEVNGNTLTNMGHQTLNVEGDSVTFGFYSSSTSSYGGGYGYYAIIKGVYRSATYEEPTKDNMSFMGWYTNPECTAGNEYIEGTPDITRVYAKWGYKIQYDTNGGSSLSNNSVIIDIGNEIGELPISTSKTGYYLEGWYTSLDSSGVKVESDYVPTSNITLYAKWKKSVESMNITTTAISLGYNQEETIQIANASEIEEEYTFESENPVVAIVDQTGKVTGKYIGRTNIIIKGKKSNKTKTVMVVVNFEYTMTYDANGGVFDNNETINIVGYGESSVKYSHTQNVDDTGMQISNYGDGWSNSNIRGTERTSSSSNAHVITIPGATRLIIDIYYNGESIIYDWVSVWEGSHSSYTATDNYSSAISGADKLGGAQTGTYLVNGNLLSNMGHKTLEINGDTVTFGFKTDGSQCGNGYGYYAIIRKDTYKEPTRNNMSFVGWYKDANCTPGQEYVEGSIVSDSTVYAKWGYAVTFNANGGNNITPQNILVGSSDIPIGTLPTSTKTDYVLDGWYTSIDGGTKIDENYTPTSNVIMYAHWKKAVSLMDISNSSIFVDKKFTQQINITNLDDIGEEYTFESSNPSIATVDQNGIVTGVTSGTTTITIRGLLSNTTTSVSVTVSTNTIVTYDANGGEFSNHSTINNTYQAGRIVKNSHTSNVDDTGLKSSNCTSGMSNTSIRGTGRTSASSEAHVVTIPGVSQIEVDIYYSTYNSSYDWVTVWSGSYPNYTAASNYSSGITGATKLGGSQSGSYTVNGNSLTSIGYKKLVVSGNTVTFGFKTSYNGGYGYYALVKAKDIPDLYEEPTRSNYSFIGWYKDAECSAGQEFNIEEITSDITVYADWGVEITYDVNGGTNLDQNIQKISAENSIGTLPTTTRTGYYFDGWYTSLDSTGIKITADYVPTTSITLYAKWKKSVESITTNPSSINIEQGESLSFIITNSAEIEEEYTIESENALIATVDQSLTVTGISNGTTNIIIRGNTSNQVKSIPVSVYPKYIINYNANGGKFSNNETSNTVFYKRLSNIKYSHTSNVDDTGYKVSNYGNNWTNANITGTDRGSTSNAHVVTIPNADQLVVEIYYNGQSTSYDWVTIWSGSHPNYTATSYYSSGISGATKLGGGQSGSYTVNGNSLTSMGYKRLVVDGDTVTFGFRSDSSGYGQGYGYYAIVEGIDIVDTYEAPTRENMVFMGWYDDVNCTSGHEVDVTKISEDTTLYAKWGYTITFNVNGGSSISNNPRTIGENNTIGSLPNPTKSGYYFDGWYTLLDGGEKITSSYIPNSNQTLYAHWKKSVSSMTIESISLRVAINESETINITNSTEIEEEYTFTSNNTTIATVNNSGSVTGVNRGTTTITIRGAKSNHTKSVSIEVYEKYTVMYDANGGTFANNETSKQVIYEEYTSVAYSHSANVTDTGYKNSNYTDNQDNRYIRGTGRTSESTDAHVVTISGEKKLTIDIYYNGESISYDWVSVWAGNHPSYTATNNYSSAISGADKLGGVQTGTYVVNGITLYNMGHKTLEVDGDTVTFGFKTDISSCGNGYGYYAIIRGASALESENYEEPTKNNAEFSGWYTDQECTTGNEFDEEHVSENITVYAKWVYTITYNTNADFYIAPNTKKVKCGAEIGNLPTSITRTGYYFDGWYTLPVGGEKLTTSYIPTSSMTIYAGWKKSVESMNLSSNTISLTIGKSRLINILNASEIEEEYTFTSSNTQIATVSSTGIITAVAIGNATITIKGTTSNKTKTISVNVTQLEEYNITLDSNGGDINKDIHYVSMTSLDYLPTPKNNNYKFLGWYTGITDGIRVDADYYPENDMTLYARWSNQKEYRVSFNTQEGSEVEDIIVNENATIATLPISYKDQYHLSGWYTGLTDGIKVETNYTPTADVILYARWTAASTYTITLDANGGSVIQSTYSVYLDTPIGELPIPTKSGYNFVGWLDESTNNYYSPTTIPTGNVTLKAQWNATNYVARINDNYYSSITNAISNANENDTIVLIKNTSETVTNSKKVTLDLNGYKLTGDITNNTNGDLTIINGTIEGNSITTTLISNSGKLILGTNRYNLNDKVTLNLIIAANSSIYGIYGGEVIVNNANINVTALSGTAIDATGICATVITINGGNIEVTNNSGSSTNSNGISFLNDNSKCIVNGGKIFTKSTTYSPSTINVNKNNTIVTINDGVLESLNTSSSPAAKTIHISSSSNTIIMNGGTLIANSPFRGLPIYSGTGYQDNFILVNGGSVTAGPTSNTDHGSILFCSDNSSTVFYINGGTHHLVYGSKESNTRSIQNKGTTYIYGGEITIEPETSLKTIYPISTIGKVYYYGGVFKEKASNSALTDDSGLVLPSGKAVRSTTDSDGYTVFSLGDS